MKKNYLIITVLFFASIVSAQTPTKTVYFDCQYNATMYPSPAPWNNFYYNSDMDFNDANGNVAGHMVLAGWTQGNSSGTATPVAPAANDFPTSMQTQDNIYGQNAGSVGTITLTGLNASRVYTFTIFASRDGVSDNRETLYTATGLNSANAALNPSGNAANVCVISNIQPDATGKIVFSAQAGPNNVHASKYFYLACFKMVEYDLSTNIKPVSQTKVFYANNTLYSGSENAVVKIYSITGSKIKEAKLNNGTLQVNLKPGIYFVETDKLTSKMVVR